MFLRRFQRRKDGKVHSYWALVESYRTARGSRQRTISYLGELQPSEQSGWAQLAHKLNGRAPSESSPRSLFDPPPFDMQAHSMPADDEPVLVRLKDVRLERQRGFGDVWLARGLWRLLGLDALLAELMPPGREDVPWPVVAAILTIARFCQPSSELHIETTWYRGTALDDLLGVTPEKVHTDRLYAGLDQLLPHKEAIEKHLKQRLGDLFDLEYELLLYDVTSTYFEGQCRANPMAKRGYSRDKRPDCLQVCIALVVTTDGIPLGYEVFDGNRHDSTTVEEIVQAIEKKYGRANRVWVLDRGMVSEENLQFLRDRGGQYIVGTPKAVLRSFEQQLLEQNWQQVQEGVEVKLVPAPEGQETFILARSAERREKERAIHQRFVNRMEQGLQKLQAAAASGRLKDRGTANRRLGRLQGENSRAARAFEVNIETLDPPQDKAHLRITWTRSAPWSQWAELSEGCYLLRSNLQKTDAGTLWKRYIQLTDAEWAFRVTKDELVIRPIWHHKEGRVKAHILVCFLAYVLWKTLAQWMSRCGLGDAPRPLLSAMSKVRSADVVLPVQTRQGARRTVRLRCVTEPDEDQRLFLHRLGLTPPRRLRRLDENQTETGDENQPL
jgi:transposase